jgi:hypothetical protein
VYTSSHATVADFNFTLACITITVHLALTCETTTQDPIAMGPSFRYAIYMA